MKGTELGLEGEGADEGQGTLFGRRGAGNSGAVLKLRGSREEAGCRADLEAAGGGSPAGRLELQLDLTLLLLLLLHQGQLLLVLLVLLRRERCRGTGAAAVSVQGYSAALLVT